MIVAGLVGALIAAVITVIALNFVAGEKQIQRKLEHRYTIDDPQFRRELGILLGPPIIDGNRVTNPSVRTPYRHTHRAAAIRRRPVAAYPQHTRPRRAASRLAPTDR